MLLKTGQANIILQIGDNPQMRVLILSTAPLTQVIHALPVVSDLRREFPKLAIDWCLEEAFSPVVRFHSELDRILPVPIERWSKRWFSIRTWREIKAFRRNLQAVDYDAILDLQGSIQSALIAHQACGPVCGYDAAAAHHRLAARFYDATFLIPKVIHGVERSRWLVAAALELPLETPLDYGIGATPLSADWCPTPPYVVFLIDGDESRGWPSAHWIALGKALHTKGYITVLAVSTKQALTHAGHLAAAIPDAVLAPELSIEILAGLMAGAIGAIGVNGVGTQLAAALRRPVVALNTGADPVLDGVLGTAPFRNLGEQGKIPPVSTVLNAFLTCIG